MVYVLIAIALFGALTLTLSNQNNNADGQNLDDEKVELYANELIEYIASAQNVIDMMMATGTEVSELNFVNPTSTGFNTPPHQHKVFHPQGGGFNYQEKFNNEISGGVAHQWYIQNNLNVEWTKTTQNDVIMIAYNINPEICAELNKKITGSTTIPALSVALNDIFDPDNFTETAFDTGNCSDCDGHPSLCISNSVADTFGFYDIIVAN